jgi:hypothetical protein
LISQLQEENEHLDAFESNWDCDHNAHVRSLQICSKTSCPQ